MALTLVPDLPADATTTPGATSGPQTKTVMPRCGMCLAPADEVIVHRNPTAHPSLLEREPACNAHCAQLCAEIRQQGRVVIGITDADILLYADTTPRR